GAGGDILDGAVGLAPNDAYLAGAGVDAAERSPDVAVLDAGDPGGATGERAAAARVECVHAGLADEPDARAADGEIDEVAARARSRWHQQDDGNRYECKCDQTNEARSSRTVRARAQATNCISAGSRCASRQARAHPVSGAGSDSPGQ